MSAETEPMVLIPDRLLRICHAGAFKTKISLQRGEMSPRSELEHLADAEEELLALIGSARESRE